MEGRERAQERFAPAEVTRRGARCASQVPPTRTGRTRRSGSLQPLDLSPASWHSWARVVEGPYRCWWACTWCELGAVIPIPRSKGVGVAMDHRGSDPRVAFQPALGGSGGPSQRLLGSLMT